MVNALGQMPKKDVVHCEKPRGAVQAQYPGCPNGETHQESCLGTLIEHIELMREPGN